MRGLFSVIIRSRWGLDHTTVGWRKWREELKVLGYRGARSWIGSPFRSRTCCQERLVGFMKILWKRYSTWMKLVQLLSCLVNGVFLFFLIHPSTAGSCIPFVMIYRSLTCLFVTTCTKKYWEYPMWEIYKIVGILVTVPKTRVFMESRLTNFCISTCTLNFVMSSDFTTYSK